ncbi:META domain-containing protein [Novosphingobium sp. JCM 18896]|uniref:META domain-containing protein n=1 Tax=Novosphingobium sp. JCM 18896 TaxID=2989731 RepID=UPI0022239D5E|nr:META domain-containing protein [Novosphingobium sp. JCM 18896]MCW1427887.1 META domain-containing protein [Novosphingobium sp. JCM 18896]
MRKLSIPLALLALLAGCATTSTGTAPTPKLVLADSEWRVTTIDGTPPVGEASLAFRPDRLVASAGCNRLGGTWSENAGKLVVGPLMSTRMFCEGKMEQERALSDLLGGEPAVTLSGDRLSLRTTAHAVELVRK